MATRKTEIQQISEKLLDALERQFEVTHNIRQEGKLFIIPEALTLTDAVAALQEHINLMNKTAEKSIQVTCHPDDGLHAFAKALRNQFHQILGEATMSFFGNIPGEISITIGHGVTETVPYNVIKLPGMSGKIDIEVSVRSNSKDPMEGTVYANIRYLRKYEPIVLEIEKEWRRVLATESIFSGAAIDSEWQFLPLTNTDTSKLVYSVRDMEQLDSDIFDPIRNTERFRKAGENIKRTVLFHGPYGTGKTLTAFMVAKVAVENGWTFINVKPGDSIVTSLNFAKRFQPCVVFFEDVDQETQGPRDGRLNEVLNTIDNLLDKNVDVITVLTTNRVEYLNRAMLRPGRIDTVLRLGVLDSDTVYRLVKVQAGHMLEGDLDEAELFEACLGNTESPYVQAFIVEGVRRARRFALVSNPTADPLNVKITHNNIVSALYGLRGQWDLMNSQQKEKERTTLDQIFRGMFEDTTSDIGERVVEELKNYVG